MSCRTSVMDEEAPEKHDDPRHRTSSDVAIDTYKKWGETDDEDTIPERTSVRKILRPAWVKKAEGDEEEERTAPRRHDV